VNTYERMFYEEVREKKTVGRGVFSRRGKGVKHTIRGIKTPYDYLSAKQKRELNSDVRSFNMYEKIIKVEEFSELDRETQRNMFIKWRDLYSNAEIMNTMGVRGNNAFQKIIKELDIPLKQTRKPVHKKAKTTVSKIQQSPIGETLIKEVTQQPQQVQQPVKIIINGLHLEYNGIFDPNQLSKIFTKLQLLTDGEESDYYLTLTLTEEPTSREKPKEDIFSRKDENGSPELQEEAKQWRENLG
jgi:hypothetical protein